MRKADWYQDDLNWIISKNVMILKDFYQETGIQPYIAFIPYSSNLWNGNDLNETKADAYLQTLYQNKFQDEGHFIFAYFSCQFDSRNEMDGQFRYVSGYAADSIMDREAVSILWGYYKKYYYDTSLTMEEMISTTFSKTADSIMDKATNGGDFAKNDPRYFIEKHGYPLIIDEVQYAPILMEIIEEIVNRKRLENGNANGMFILTGSQTFQLMRGVTQSMAGRAAVLKKGAAK